jgi:DNA invertase Pin-like site-specific DNA recombinase
MTVFGYARVSTNGQDLASQQAQLRAAGCEQGNIYAEKISGAANEREQLNRVLAELCDGDVLIVTRLDRLARSTRNLLNILDTISRAGAGFRSLSDEWANTTSAHGKLMLCVLAGISEFERSLIHARTSEGRNRARAAGVKFGRKPKLTPEQIHEARERRSRGETLHSIGAAYNLHSTTVGRLLQ